MPKSREEIGALIEQMAGIAGKMAKIYEQNPDLNDTQPDSMSECFPYSLDEWHLNLLDLAEEWKDGDGS